jgi:thermostable 8-oxoguanine DNA glycosylase
MQFDIAYCIPDQAESSPMQTVLELIDGRAERLFIPAPEHHVLPGVRWGLVQALFTPAYWAAQLWHSTWSGGYADYAWSGNLRHEIAACLLGGHGITYEINRAAFDRLRTEGLLDRVGVALTAIVEALVEPLKVGDRSVRYRFPRQKGRFVHAALERLDRETPPIDSAANLRQWLLDCPGIGMKTASWIARNALLSSKVAVIDIHIFRAGVIMGLFAPTKKLPRDYIFLEARFLKFASAIAADPRRLDVMMWWQMREAGSLAIQHFAQAA